MLGTERHTRTLPLFLDILIFVWIFILPHTYHVYIRIHFSFRTNLVLKLRFQMLKIVYQGILLIHTYRFCRKSMWIKIILATRETSTESQRKCQTRHTCWRSPAEGRNSKMFFFGWVLSFLSYQCLILKGGHPPVRFRDRKRTDFRNVRNFFSTTITNVYTISMIF